MSRILNGPACVLPVVFTLYTYDNKIGLHMYNRDKAIQIVTKRRFAIIDL